eukprot:gene40276-53237_t
MVPTLAVRRPRLCAEHGSDLGSAQTKALRDGDEYVINGSKIWTSLGDRADYMILLARTSNDGPSKYAGLSFFLAPMKIPGVETRRLGAVDDGAAADQQGECIGRRVLPSANVPRPSGSSFISLRKAPRQRERSAPLWKLHLLALRGTSCRMARLFRRAACLAAGRRCESSDADARYQKATAGVLLAPRPSNQLPQKPPKTRRIFSKTHSLSLKHSCGSATGKTSTGATGMGLGDWTTCSGLRLNLLARLQSSFSLARKRGAGRRLKPKPHSRCHRAQGAGCSPQRNKGGGRRPGDIRGGEYPVACARTPNNRRKTQMTDFLHDETLIAPPRTVRIDFDDGSFALRSPVALKPYARCIGEWIERWARETPDALALAERDETGEGWRKLDYRALRQAVGAVAQALLDMNLPAGQPVVILSDNAIDHAVLMLAAMHIGRT